MRRVVEIVVAFTSATGHPHPHLMAAANNYAALLMAMEETKEEAVAKALALLAPVMEKLPAS